MGARIGGVILAGLLGGCAARQPAIPVDVGTWGTTRDRLEQLAREAGFEGGVNEGCDPNPPQQGLKVCALLAGKHTYSVNSGVQYVWLTNYSGQTLSVVKVRTVTLPAAWAEISVYLDFLGTCPAPPDHCPGANLPEGSCPCMKDADPGSGLRPVGAVGNIFENAFPPAKGLIPDLTWGEGFEVAPGSFVVLGDNVHGSSGTMYEVEVKEGGSNDLLLRQPKVDNVVHCSGGTQQSAFEPWQLDKDAVLTGAQVYAANPGSSSQLKVAWACIYIFNDPPDWAHPIWKRCGNDLATTDSNARGNVRFEPPVQVKAGQYVVGHASNKCAGGVWDYVATITGRRVK